MLISSTNSADNSAKIILEPSTKLVWNKQHGGQIFVGAISSRFRKAFSKHGAAGYPRKISHKKGKMVFENTLETQT